MQLNLNKLEGTEFQKKVWKEIYKIPKGQTKTYKKIAILVGSPKSSRAVANAFGKMALTNYITQTLFCYIVLNILFIDAELTRKEIFIFVLIIWVIQLIWSKYWLNKFKYGPLEFISRKITYIK